MGWNRQGQANVVLVIWWAKTAINIAVGVVLLRYWAGSGYSLAGLFIAVVIGSMLVAINGAGPPPWVDRD